MSGRRARFVVPAGLLDSFRGVQWTKLVSPAGLVCTGVVLSMFSGNWGLLGFPRLLAPDRFFLVAGLILALSLRDRRTRLSFGAPEALLSISLCALALNAAAAGTLLSKAGIFAAFDYYGVMPFVLFAAAGAIFPDEASRRLLLRTLIGMGVYLSVTAVFEMIGPQALVFPSVITDPNLGIHHGRARGPFLEASVNGLVIFMTAVAVVLASLHSRVSSRQRLLLHVLLGLCALALLLTVQRSVWLASALGVAAAAVSIPRMRQYLPVLLIATGLLVSGVLVASPDIRDRVMGRAATKSSVWDRQNLNAAARNMVEAQPLTGVGWQRFEDESDDYVSLLPDVPMTKIGDLPVHNVYLAYAAELGLIGLFFWGLPLVVIMTMALTAARRTHGELRGWSLALVPILTAWAVVAAFAPLVTVLPNLLIWLWAGVILRTGPDQETDMSSGAPPPATSIGLHSPRRQGRVVH